MKPKILVLKGQQEITRQIIDTLAESYQVVLVDSLWRGLALLRHGGYAGAYVEAADLAPLERAGVLLQADLVLDAMRDGVALLDPEFKVLWANRQFGQWVQPEEDGRRRPAVGRPFYQALGNPSILGPDFCPLHSAVESKQSGSSTLRTAEDRYLRVIATPVLDEHQKLSHVIAIVHDITREYLQQQKINTLHDLATKLADLDPDELAEMSSEERTAMLKGNILRYAREVLHYSHMEIFLVDPVTRRLDLLLSEGMPEEGRDRVLFARREGNGISGFVAASGQSYLCEDTQSDPLYLPGSPGARSSMTVPLTWQDRIIGVFNVESPRPRAFTPDDLLFLEVFARNVSMALHTFELLRVEKVTTATEWVERIRREAGVRINDILSDAAALLESYVGHEPPVEQRLRQIQDNARAAAEAFRAAGERLEPLGPAKLAARLERPRLKGRRILVADPDMQVRLSAYEHLSRAGCIVETAHTGAEAVAMAKTQAYDAALADIRLPDKNGYEVFTELKRHRPQMPVILMTAFGYDPAHSIVKARAEGLKSVLFKPFRPEKLIEELEQAVGDGLPPDRTT